MVWPLSNPPGYARAAQAKKEKAAALKDAFSRVALLIDMEVSVENDLAYLSASASDIVKNIEESKGEWTATRVLQAFIRAVVRNHAKLNAVTETFFEDALHAAQILDDEFKRTGVLLGPLHGVPMSLKDQIDVKGSDSCMGYSARCHQAAKEDATVVRYLKLAGAIPFVKSNVPQTMLAFNCANPTFGSSSNPYDHTRTPGGSSGGEGALIGSDCSPLGVGSDIGGSLRIPSHYSGCFALKPSLGRFPSLGIQAPYKGWEGVIASLGPMGRCVDDLILLTKVLFNAAATESAQFPKLVLPYPFREVQLPSKLKFGFYKSDNLVQASPACQRAVSETVSALKMAGHECVELDPPDTTHALKLFVAMSSADGYENLLNSLDGDPPESALFLIRLQRQLGPRLTSILSRLAPYDERVSSITASSGVKTVFELRQWQVKRDEFVEQVRGLFWGQLELDGIIGPVQAIPALKDDQIWNLAFLAATTLIYNLVESSVGVIPVTKVDQAKDGLTKEWLESGPSKTSPTLDRLLYGKDKLSGGVYNAKDMHGLPVGVQIIGPLWQEEKVLQMMKVVERAVGNIPFGPGRWAASHQAT